MIRRSEWRHGWPVIVAAMIGISNTPGLFQNLSSLFTPGMVTEFGWTRGDLATASGLGLLGGLVVPFLGRIADRVGARPVIVAAMLLLGAAYFGMAAQTGRLWEYQVMIVCLALTIPGTSTMIYGRLIAMRFVENRGLAIGVAVTGPSLTLLVLPPLLTMVIAAYGWRGGFVALAILASLVSLPLVLLALRGMQAGPARPDPDAPEATAEIVGLTGRETRRTGDFWRLAACGLLVNLATVGLVTQLVPFGLDHGLSAAQAAWLLASYGASQLVGRLGIGVMVDRFPPRLVAAGVAALSAIGFAVLMVPGPGFAALLIAVFLAGLMHGADNDLLPFMTARLFGLRAYGEVYGTMIMISLIGTASGIVGFGRLHDAMGSYAVAVGAATVAMTAAALLFLTLRDRDLPSAAGAAHPASA